MNRNVGVDYKIRSNEPMTSEQRQFMDEILDKAFDFSNMIGRDIVISDKELLKKEMFQRGAICFWAGLATGTVGIIALAKHEAKKDKK